jgi:predicted nucleotidyltransferase
MRLTDFEIETITSLARRHFGDDARVYLFGSRTDDSKRGGDIDLFISNKNENLLTLNAKIHFLVELKKRIGDQKIDVVFDNVCTRQKKSFYHSICAKRIDLSIAYNKNIKLNFV